MNEAGKSPSIRAETVPDLTGLSPAKARRAWLKWMADQSLDGQTSLDTHIVTLAIQELDLNFGKEAEAKSREHLAERLTAFKSAHCSGEGE